MHSAGSVNKVNISKVTLDEMLGLEIMDETDRVRDMQELARGKSEGANKQILD